MKKLIIDPDFGGANVAININRNERDKYAKANTSFSHSLQNEIQWSCKSQNAYS